MKKRGIDKELVVFLITTLITIASWVGFEVYRAYVKVNIPENVEKFLQPIDPTLKSNVFVELENLNPS